MQKLQLSIPEPCHENWQQMTPTQQGRFCNACAKEVVDFSSMTDIQVLNYFSTLTHEKVCGRALPEQLDRTISRPEQSKKRLFWYWNYLVMFFMFFSRSNIAKAQDTIKSIVVEKLVGKFVDLQNGLQGRVGGLNIQFENPIIKGKVMDAEGNGIPFATVENNETKRIAIADVNGDFTIEGKVSTVLLFSATGYKNAELKSNKEGNISIVLQRAVLGEAVVVVTMGSIDRDNYYPPYIPKEIAVLKVKDELGKAIAKAKVKIVKNNISDSALTNNKGLYKIRKIREDEVYYVQINAEGYETNEFTIDNSNFKEGKKEWEILLRRKEIKKSNPLPAATCNQTGVKLRGALTITTSDKPLIVIDGVIASNITNINPADVSDIMVLKNAQALAIYGPYGVNGAILVTTKMNKAKTLDTIVVSAISDVRKARAIGGLMTTVSKSQTSNYFTDTKARIQTLLTDSLKVYPNPVQKNSNFTIALKLKTAGKYFIEITDVTGRLLMHKPVITIDKIYTENLIADSKWSSGLYTIRVFNNADKLISKNAFIIQ